MHVLSGYWPCWTVAENDTAETLLVQPSPTGVDVLLPSLAIDTCVNVRFVPVPAKVPVGEIEVIVIEPPVAMYGSPPLWDASPMMRTQTPHVP
jgi:hypothetical protein